MRRQQFEMEPRNAIKEPRPIEHPQEPSIDQELKYREAHERIPIGRESVMFAGIRLEQSPVRDTLCEDEHRNKGQNERDDQQEALGEARITQTDDLRDRILVPLDIRYQ